MTSVQQIYFIIIILISDPISYAIGQKTDLSDIRKQYAEIRDQLKNYQIKKTEISDESSEGGSLTAYYDDTRIRLIIEEYFGETGKRVIEYYFTNQHLFFIYDLTFSYNRPIYIDSASASASGDTEWHDPLKSIKTEERFYFKNDQLILWLDPSNKPVSNQSDQFGRKEIDWINQSNQILSVFFNNDQ